MCPDPFGLLANRLHKVRQPEPRMPQSQERRSQSGYSREHQTGAVPTAMEVSCPSRGRLCPAANFTSFVS